MDSPTIPRPAETASITKLVPVTEVIPVTKCPDIYHYQYQDEAE